MKADVVKMLDASEIYIEARFRQDYKDMEGLTESIRLKGVIQPITVRAKDDKGYRLLAGGRRMQAVNALQLKKVPALIRDTEGEVDQLEIELVENVYRADMSWQEETALIEHLNEVCHIANVDWSQTKTGILLHKTRQDISRALKVSSALKVLPELALASSVHEADKILRKLEGGIIVEELRKRQNEVMARGMNDALTVADANYVVGDVFENMADLRAEGSIHMIECDPPYGIDLASVKAGEQVKTYTEIEEAEYAQFLQRLTKELYRVAGKHCWLVFWYGPTHTELVRRHLSEAGWALDDMPAIWHKLGSPGQTLQPAVNLARSYEPFFVCRKGQPAISKQGRSNVFVHPPVGTASKFHPTQRPLSLIVDILETFTVTGQVVLSPFLGSGTTLRACYQLGLLGFGCDLNAEYKDRFMLAVEADVKEMDDEHDEAQPGTAA